MRICVDLGNIFNRIDVKLLLLDFFQLMNNRPVLTHDRIQPSDVSLEYFRCFLKVYCLRILIADKNRRVLLPIILSLLKIFFVIVVFIDAKRSVIGL